MLRDSSRHSACDLPIRPPPSASTGLACFCALVAFLFRTFCICSFHLEARWLVGKTQAHPHPRANLPYTQRIVTESCVVALDVYGSSVRLPLTLRPRWLDYKTQTHPPADLPIRSALWRRAVWLLLTCTRVSRTTSSSTPTAWRSCWPRPLVAVAAEQKKRRTRMFAVFLSAYTAGPWRPLVLPMKGA